MRLTILLSISSLALMACHTVERPNSMVYGVNGAAARLEGYNIKSDYDENGIRKPEAELKLRALPEGLRSMNGAICFLPPNGEDEGTAGVKRWLAELRLWGKDHCH